MLGFTSADEDLSSLRIEDRDTDRGSVKLTPESLEPSSILGYGGMW